MTLDEWVEKCAPKLKENLQTNIDVFCDGMTADERQAFMRLNLIMIRQWALDWGVE